MKISIATGKERRISFEKIIIDLLAAQPSRGLFGPLENFDIKPSALQTPATTQSRETRADDDDGSHAQTSSCSRPGTGSLWPLSGLGRYLASSCVSSNSISTLGKNGLRRNAPP